MCYQNKTMWKDILEQYKKLFQKTLDNKNWLKMDKDTRITIHDFSIEPSGCGGCNVKYDAISLYGRMENKEYNFIGTYSANISPYHMLCQCDYQKNTKGDYDQCRHPIFKGYLENTEYCVYHRFITKNTFKKNKNNLF